VHDVQAGQQKLVHREEFELARQSPTASPVGLAAGPSAPRRESSRAG
jgi:hypothetical protein